MKAGALWWTSHCWKVINTRMQKTQFPCRSFHLSALESRQYRSLALRTVHLQLHNSFRTNFQQKGSHPEAKSHQRRFFRFWEYRVTQANEGVGLRVYCLGRNSVPRINKCINAQMGCISLAPNTELGMKVVIVWTETDHLWPRQRSLRYFKSWLEHRVNGSVLEKDCCITYIPCQVFLYCRRCGGQAIKIANLLF